MSESYPGISVPRQSNCLPPGGRRTTKWWKEPAKVIGRSKLFAIRALPQSPDGAGSLRGGALPGGNGAAVTFIFPFSFPGQNRVSKK